MLDYALCTTEKCNLKTFCNRAETHHKERLSKTIIPQSFKAYKPKKKDCVGFIAKI